MNAAAAPATGGMLGGSGKMIFMAVGLVVLAIAVYYLYRFMQGSDEKQDMVVYSMAGRGLVGTKETVFDTNNIPTLYGGGEYSVSLWVYVNNWGLSKGKNKRILKIVSGGSAGYASLVIYMGQYVNKLGVRTSFESATSPTGNNLDATKLVNIDNGTTPFSDTATDFQKCDIETIDLQRWVNVTVVLSGRTVDVYIDGKLSRSCVNEGLFKVADPNTAQIIVGAPSSSGSSLGGYIGSIRAANFAYTPDTIYQIYQQGPRDESILSQIKSWFDPSAYSISLKRDGKDIVSASTG